MLTAEQADHIRDRLRQTLRALEEKQRTSGEEIIGDYVQRYRAALASLEAGEAEDGEGRGARSLRRLLDLARGYLETSSDWNQEFLNEMGQTEEAIEEALRTP